MKLFKNKREKELDQFVRDTKSRIRREYIYIGLCPYCKGSRISKHTKQVRVYTGQLKFTKEKNYAMEREREDHTNTFTHNEMLSFPELFCMDCIKKFKIEEVILA